MNVGFKPSKERFVKHFDVIINIVVGLYDLMIFRNFSNLGHMMTSATFHI